MATEASEDLSKRPSIPDDRLVLYVKKGEIQGSNLPTPLSDIIIIALVAANSMSST